MALWSDKTLISWTEPKLARETREALVREDSSRLVEILAAIGVGLLFLLKLGLRLGKKNNWPIILIVVGVVALGFLYLRPRLRALYPSVIQLTDKAITQTVANRGTKWKMCDLASFQLIISEDNDAPVLLALEPKTGTRVILGVDAGVDLDELQRLLSDRIAAKR